jgi:N-dimethylarginine dimethylaminohydrolase|tara:strand:- start:142 stop:927 length:786 start_codon:yes stop_codon:yes gene_type:complete
METFLLCKPDYFKIDYSINPWMSGGFVNLNLAKDQWESLKLAIECLGSKVKTISQINNLPDMVFTANSGLVFENKFIVSSMKHSERKGESRYFRDWFLKNGYRTLDLPPDISFEGRGDCLLYNNHIIGGYGYRTDLDALEAVSETLALPLISLKLADPRFYHLDTCFCMISKHSAIYYPEAFEKNEIEKLKDKIELIPVSESDAALFMCNSMLVGNTLLIPSSYSSIDKVLRNNYGIKTCLVNVSEFLKSGGSIQCLCLKI